MYKISLFILVLSLLACSSSKKSSSSSEGGNTAERVGEELAPGTAKVRFTVKEISTDQEETVWGIYVHEVLGYGSATPLISSDTIMPVNTTTFLAYSEHTSEYYMNKEQLTGIFEAVGERPGNDNKRTNWKLTSIPDKN